MRLVAAELRDSWRAWAGVSLPLTVTSFGIGLANLVLAAGTRIESLGIERIEAQGVMVLAGMNLAMCVLVGLSVIDAATGLVVASRRGSLARLALAGASPGTVVRTVLAQLAAACLVCGVVGGALAVALFPASWRYLARDRGMPYPDVTPDLLTLLAAVLPCVGVALLGGLRRAVQASRIPPVEALREAQAPSRERGAVARWIGFVLVLAMLALSYRAGLAAVREGGQAARSVTLQVPTLVIHPGAGGLFRAGP